MFRMFLKSGSAERGMTTSATRKYIGEKKLLKKCLKAEVQKCGNIKSQYSLLRRKSCSSGTERRDVYAIRPAPVVLNTALTAFTVLTAFTALIDRVYRVDRVD